MTNSNQNNENFPKILYKYLPLKDLTHFYYRNTNIYSPVSSKNMIFFPDYKKLNDPSEGYTYGIIAKDEKLNGHPLIKYLKLKFRILSLTKDCFNESMWDRYAGGYDSLNKTYEGICIGFKTNGKFNKARKIEYIDKEPKEIYITEEFNELKNYFKKDNISYEDEEYKNLVEALKEKIKESFFYKYEHWKYEKEYRIVEEHNFFLNSEKELEFELIKCIFKKNNSEGFEKFIKNISEVKTKLTLNTDPKEEPICPYKDLKKFYKKFIHDISKKEILFYKIIYVKNKNSNEVINKIIEEIYKMNENSRKKGNKSYNYDFFKYSHEEITCLIRGCDLHKKFTEIDEKNIEHIQKYRYNFMNSFIKIFEKQKIETKELINKKQIEEIGEKIDKLLSSNENNNNNYLKMLKNITDTMKYYYKNYYEKGYYNSYGIFIPFYFHKVDYNKYEKLQPHSPTINFDSDTINIQLFYIHELNLKSQIIEIYGDKKFVDKKLLPNLSKSYEKHSLISYYYEFILFYGYSQFSDFFNEKIFGKDIKIKMEHIENYKNSPEKLEKDMKDFYKNHPVKLENIEKYSKIINVLSKYEPTCEPKNDDPPSAFYFTFFISSYYNSLNLFFNNKLEKLEKLKKLNKKFYENYKKFYENFKNIKFYKTITENSQIQLKNCITGKIIKNQEELEKDIENQEELEKDIEEDKKIKNQKFLL